jgi:hypothetical protein
MNCEVINNSASMGFIEYNRKLEVHNSLLNVVLYGKREIKTKTAGKGSRSLAADEKSPGNAQGACRA